MPQTQQQQPPDTLPADFFDKLPPAAPTPPAQQAAPSQPAAPTQPPPDTLPADFNFDQPSNDPRFSTASLGPNFQPDYETTVYAKPLPPDAPPGFWGSIWNHIKDAQLAPFDIAIPGLYRGAAQSSHLLGNAMDVLDKTEGFLADLTRSQRVNWFRNASDWFHSQGAGAQQTAQQFSAGNQSFPAELGRSIVQGATQLPTLGLATAAGGLAAPALLGELGPSMVGFGGLGALEQEDKGLVPALTGGAGGAATGGMFHIIGQTGLPLRVPISSWLGYLQSRLGGANPSDALANGATMGLFSLLGGPGGAGPRDITRNLAEPLANKLLPFSPQKSAAAQQVIDLGQKYGVRLTAGDISQLPFLKNAELGLEKVPLQGMQKLRMAQNLEAKTAAQGLVSQYHEALLDTDPSSIDALEQAAAAGDGRARNVLNQMNEAGNDPDRIIQASIGLGDWTTRQTANNLYDNVQKLAEEHNLGDVPMDATGKAIGSSLRELQPAKLKNKEVIRLIQEIKESISPTVDEAGKQVMPDNSYGLIRQLHSDLGDRIREYYKGNNALIGEKGVGHLERVQNALEDDMRNYALNSNVPEIVDAGRQADTYYKTARVPYKNGMLASAAASTEPDQIYKQFIKQDKGDRAQNFYDALDDRGRAAIRYNMVAAAVKDATNPQSGIFSPQKFFTNVEHLDDAYGVFFKAKDKAEIKGFQNLMGHVIRSGQYAESPPTGNRLMPWMIGLGSLEAGKTLGVFANPWTATATGALLGMSRALFTTTRGRNLLLRLNGIKPGTPIMDSVWQEVGREIPKLAAKPPEEPPEPPEEPPPSAGGPPPPPPAPSGRGAAGTPSGGGAAAGGTGLGQIGEMGQAITGNMYRMLWDKVQKGDVTEAGGPSPLLKAASVIREGGGLKTMDDFRAMANEYAQIPRDAQFQDRVWELTDKYLRGEAAPSGEGTPSSLTPPPTLEDRLQTLGDEALDRVRKSGIIEGRITPSLFPAEVTKDMAVWGAARIANGAIKFSKWSKAMLDDAADISPAAVEKVRAMLPQLWADSKKQYEHHANTFGAENIANLPQIMEYYEAGKEGKNWYNFVRPALQPIFGKNTDLFLKMFAATSPNTKVTQNVVNAVKAYRQFLLGEQFTGMQAHVDNLNRAVAGVKMSGPKVGAFGPNLMGDLNPVTVDLWMARALLGRDTVTPLQSKLVDYMTSQAAKKANLKPAEMQAAVWTGIKKLRNSRDTSAPPEQIVNEYLEKNPDVRKLFEDSLQMSKEHFQDLQSKQAPAKPPR